MPKRFNSVPRARARSRAWLSALGVGGLVLASKGAPSAAHDANQVHAFVIGDGAGLANSEGVDARNTNRSRVPFPRAPELGFRARVAGGIGQAPASDATGNLIVVHGEPRLSKLDAQGRTLWSTRLESEGVSAPVLTSDDSILLVNHDADALLFAPTGRLVHKSTLPFAGLHRRTLAIPLSTGGALIASGTALAELDSAGSLTRQGHAPASISGIAQWGSALLAICDNGMVTLARPSGDFETIGNLGGTAAEGGAVEHGKLFALVDEHKLVAFDLTRTTSSTLASDATVTLSGPLVLFPNQSSVAVVDGGLVSLRAANGSETLRGSLNEAGRAFDPATRALRPALLLGDATGAIAATRGGSDALILRPDGKAQRFESTACLDPFRPTPTLHGVVFACRSGQLFGVIDKAP